MLYVKNQDTKGKRKFCSKVDNTKDTKLTPRTLTKFQ